MTTMGAPSGERTTPTNSSWKRRKNQHSRENFLRAAAVDPCRRPRNSLQAGATELRRRSAEPQTASASTTRTTLLPTKVDDASTTPGRRSTAEAATSASLRPQSLGRQVVNWKWKFWKEADARQLSNDDTRGSQPFFVKPYPDSTTSRRRDYVVQLAVKKCNIYVRLRLTRERPSRTLARKTSQSNVKIHLPHVVRQRTQRTNALTGCNRKLLTD